MTDTRETWLWRNFAAMITEYKAGVMALSFTRVLGMITFVVWLLLEILYTVGVIATAPTMSMVAILATLIGVKGFKDGMMAFKRGSSYEANQ